MSHVLPGWILTETQFLAEHFNAYGVSNCSKLPLEEISAYPVLTRGEALVTIARGLSDIVGQSFIILSPNERLILLNALVLENRDIYPDIVRNFNFQSVFLNFKEGERLLKFLDKIRLYECKDSIFEILLKENDQEKGRTSEKRLEQTILLCDAYQNFLERNGLIDFSRACEWLLEKLFVPAAKSKLFELLPESITLYCPTFFHPIEERLWDALSNLCSLHCVYHPDSVNLENELGETKTSCAHFRKLKYFLDRKIFKEKSVLPLADSKAKIRRSLCDQAFDLLSCPNPETLKECSGVEIIECETRRSEVKQAFSRLEVILEQDKTEFSDVHVFVNDLQAYRSIMLEEAERYGLSLKLCRGTPISNTIAAQMFCKYLEWVTKQNLHTYINYFSSSSISNWCPADEELIPYLKPYISSDSELKHMLLMKRGISEDDNMLLAKAALLRELETFCRREGISTQEQLSPKVYERISLRLNINKTRTTKNLEPIKDHYTKLQLVLAIVHWAQEAANALDLKSLTMAEVISKLQQSFFTDRRTFTHKEHLSEEVRRLIVDSSRSYLYLRRVLSQSIKDIKFGARVKSEILTDIAEIQEYLKTQFANSYLPRIYNKESECKVISVTEMLDMRGRFPRCAVFLGLTVQDLDTTFQQFQIGGYHFADKLSGMVEEYAGDLGGSYQYFALLRLILISAERVIFTLPQYSETGESVAAPFLKEFARMPCVRRHHFSNFFEKSDGIDEFFSNYSSDRVSALLRARNSVDCLQYDGSIGADVAIQALNQSFRGKPCVKYSVSDLEMFADCPHRFYFLKILKLSPEKTFKEILASELGTIIHSALEKFFKKIQSGALILSRESHKHCAKKLAQIAELEFSESIIDWETTPQSRSLKAKALEGLDCAVEEQSLSQARVGPLYAALDYQLKLVKTLPKHLEFKFGIADTPGLILEGASRQILLRGIIDRIDAGEHGWRLWDYKTGSSGNLARIDDPGNLQLPVYAAAVSQVIGGRVERGGLIVLSEANRRDKDLDSISKGVIREMLAVERKGRGYTLSLRPELVEARIARAMETILDLDKLAASGLFTQHLGTKACSYCEFRGICSRNEAILEKRASICDYEPQSTLISKTGQLQNQPDQEERSILDTGRAYNQQLSDSQQRAVDFDKGLTVVSAGAGSGKTHLMIAKIIQCLIEGMQPASILAITFTEKAAAELKGRLSSSISQILLGGKYSNQCLSDKQKDYLLNAKYRLNEMSIGTIHGFAAQIASILPESKTSRGTLLAAGEAKDILSRIVESIIHFPDNPQVEFKLEELLKAGVSLGVIRESISRLLPLIRAAKAQGEVNQLEMTQILERKIKDAASQFAISVINTLNEWSSACRGWLQSPETKLSDEQENAFSQVAARVDSVIVLLKSISGSGRYQELAKELSSLKKYLEENRHLAKRKSKSNPRNFWKELGEELDKSDYELYSVGSEDDVLGQECVNLIQDLTEYAIKVYEKEKTLSGKFDFEDLIFEAHRITAFDDLSVMGVREELKRRFKLVLIDEFQDTDILQFQIIKSISDLDKSDTDTSIIVVGDRQQAIYGFRGGDVSVFDKAVQIAESNKRPVIYLEDNYRSLTGIINFVNDFFEKLSNITARDSNLYVDNVAIAFHSMTPIRGSDSKWLDNNELEVEIVNPARDKIAGESAELNEAEAVADLIEAQLEKLYDKGKKFNTSPIAVLARSSSQLTTLASVLQVRAINYSLNHSCGFFDREEIVYLENLLRWLANNNDLISLVGVLRSPLFGLTDAELYYFISEFRAANLQFCLSAEQKKSAFEEIWRRLKELTDLTEVLSISELLKKVVNNSCLSEAYLKADTPEQYENIQRFLDRLELSEEAGQINSSPLSALQWLESQRKDPKGAPVANSTLAPILLSTIHGAKGLEFPIVILPFLRKKLHRDRNVFIVRDVDGMSMAAIKVESPQHNYLQKKTARTVYLEQRELYRQSLEEQRLFYVACTRAKDKLLLVVKDGSKQENARVQSALQSPRKLANLLASSSSPALWLQGIYPESNLT